MKLKLPRIVHRIYAFCRGFFWMNCCMCYEYFGGHENHGTLMITHDGGRIVCPNCVDEANRRNQELCDKYEKYCKKIKRNLRPFEAIRE